MTMWPIYPKEDNHNYFLFVICISKENTGKEGVSRNSGMVH